jgi:hypothetical protein
MFYAMAVIEFLVAEKESVMSIHRWLMCTVSVLLIKELLVVGLHKFQVLRKTKQSFMTYVTLGSQQPQSLRHCFNLLVNSFEVMYYNQITCN